MQHPKIFTPSHYIEAFLLACLLPRYHDRLDDAYQCLHSTARLGYHMNDIATHHVPFFPHNHNWPKEKEQRPPPNGPNANVIDGVAGGHHTHHPDKDSEEETHQRTLDLV
jgi:hypothetical protein